MSEPFLEVLDRNIDAVLESNNVIFACRVLALLRQFLKVGYDCAKTLGQDSSIKSLDTGCHRQRLRA